jgi:RNA polymerase sigma-70 factor (ECF subfamily)
MLEEALRVHRDLLWGLCYRMLGCSADADDALQATFEKALLHPPADTTLPMKPWLVRIAVNQCRDELRKRQTRASAFWLPGPLETSDTDPRFVGSESPDARYSRMQSVSLAFMVALHTLTPLQRAVLILRDVLDLSVAETAEALETSASNVKMALHRARAELAKGPVRPALYDRVTEERVLKALLVHLATHNVTALTQLLTDDVLLCNDADPDQVAAHRIVRGRDKVMLFQFKVGRSGRFAFRVLNGRPALVVDLPPLRTPSSGRVIGEPAPGHNVAARELPRQAVMWIELDARGCVTAIHVQTKRRKLEHVTAGELGWAALPQLGAAVWAAVRFPHHGAWRRTAALSLASTLGSALRSLVLSGDAGGNGRRRRRATSQTT